MRWWLVVGSPALSLQTPCIVEPGQRPVGAELDRSVQALCCSQSSSSIRIQIMTP